MSEPVFKSCSCCDAEWSTREAFLRDPSIVVIGYQVDFEELRLGYFLFNHERCRTTIALRAREFLDLYDGPVFSERRTGSDECPGYCLRSDELARCPVACECAFVREVLQIVRSPARADAGDG
jgi:hypothetical protein